MPMRTKSVLHLIRKMELKKGTNELIFKDVTQKKVNKYKELKDFAEEQKTQLSNKFMKNIKDRKKIQLFKLSSHQTQSKLEEGLPI